MTVTIITSILSINAIAGYVLLGRKNKVGWLVSSLNSIGSGIYSTITHQYGFIISNMVFAVLSINSYYRWSREEKDAKSQTSGYIEGGSVRIPSRKTEAASA